MQKKWFNPKKSMISKHDLLLHYELKPVIYGSKKQVDFLVDNVLKESDRKKYVIKKSNGIYMLCKKLKYYKKRE